MNKICPLMSNADKTVACTDKCAWYANEVDTDDKCAVFRLIDSVTYTAEMVNLNQPSEE